MSLPIARYNITVDDYECYGSYVLGQEESPNGDYCDYDEVKEYVDNLESKIEELSKLINKLHDLYLDMDRVL